jgi:hypothetical protein
VHETTSPNLKQVLSVYSWFASLIPLCFAANMFQEDLAFSSVYPGAGDFNRSSICATPPGKATQRKRVGACEG